MRRLSPLLLPLLFFALLPEILLFSGCLGSKRIDPAINFNASYTQSIKAIEASREEAVRTLGEGLERGLPINEQTIISIDRRVKLAIDLAKVALATYIESGGSKVPVYSAMSTLNAVMVELLAEVATAGLEAP